MTVELDKIIHTGDVSVAALVKRSSNGQIYQRALSFTGEKRPLAILIRHNCATLAFDVHGRRVELSDFEKCYPGQLSAFQRLTSGHFPFA